MTPVSSLHQLGGAHACDIPRDVSDGLTRGAKVYCLDCGTAWRVAFRWRRAILWLEERGRR